MDSIEIKDFIISNFFSGPEDDISPKRLIRTHKRKFKNHADFLKLEGLDVGDLAYGDFSYGTPPSDANAGGIVRQFVIIATDDQPGDYTFYVITDPNDSKILCISGTVD